MTAISLKPAFRCLLVIPSAIAVHLQRLIADEERTVGSSFAKTRLNVCSHWVSSGVIYPKETFIRSPQSGLLISIQK